MCGDFSNFLSNEILTDQFFKIGMCQFNWFFLQLSDSYTLKVLIVIAFSYVNMCVYSSKLGSIIRRFLSYLICFFFIFCCWRLSYYALEKHSHKFLRYLFYQESRYFRPTFIGTVLIHIVRKLEYFVLYHWAFLYSTSIIHAWHALC